MKITYKHSLGDYVKDGITGLEGTIIGAFSYITGCNQYLVSPPAINNKLEDVCTFDEDRLVVLKSAKPKKVKSTKKGGPAPKY